MSSKIIETHRVKSVETPVRLQEYARGIFETIPTRSGIKKAIKRQQVLRDGKPANTGDWVQEGQVISLLATEKQSNKPVFKLNFPVVFEDAYLAVIHKPAGYPSSGNYFKTIENALQHNLKASDRKDRLAQPVVVHRLDNPTSGLLLVAKTFPANTQLNLLFEHGVIHKTYEAQVEGRFPAISTIEQPVDEKRAVTSILSRKSSITEKGIITHLKLSPKTGRTHQLRRHLSGAGHPILGDRQYNSARGFKNGIALFATGLRFKHPVTGKDLNIAINPCDKS